MASDVSLVGAAERFEDKLGTTFRSMVDGNRGTTHISVLVTAAEELAVEAAVNLGGSSAADIGAGVIVEAGRGGGVVVQLPAPSS